MAKPSVGKEFRAKQIAASSVEELSATFATLTVTASKDPRATKVPGKKRELDTKVSASVRYKNFVPRGYSVGGSVHLDRVISDLPRFIAEHVKLDSNGQIPGEAPDEARGVSRRQSYPPTSRPERTYYIDCDYICTIYIPRDMNIFFEGRKEVLGVKARYCRRTYNRWIFVPSYRRAHTGYFDWSETGVDLDKTPRVIVVRPSEFNEYKRKIRLNPSLCVALLSLPEEINGIGYARYWIQRIADYLKLNWIWMIDDSVMWMRRRSERDGSLKNCSFEVVFEKIEEFAKDNNYAAVSPRVYNGLTESRVRKPLTNKPPRGVVLLNLQIIRERRVHYRPQLLCLEDMVFGYECEEAGLNVCVYNNFVFYDVLLKDSGTNASLTEASPQLSAPQ